MTRVPLSQLAFPASEEPLELEPVTLSVRRADPETSVAASASLTPGRTESLILETLRAYPSGLTADELCDELGTVFPPTLKSALARLHKAGQVTDSGRRRPSTRGRDSVVWVIA